MKRVLLALSLLFLTACSSVPFDYPKQGSNALPPTHDTLMGNQASQWTEKHPGLSGFVGLSEGVDALGARLKMTELAQQSIDAQYFIVKRDRAGALFVGKLLRAADRGVRVRLLVDDIFSPGVDHPFSVIDSHPNIEVRLFNPLSRQSLKYWSYVVDFKRANRRMHNKSFTADNALTIVGGRNIGEEYFELNQGVKFNDYEVLAIGPVVQQVSEGFDAYWNNALSVPVAAFNIKVDDQEIEQWREYIRDHVEGDSAQIYQTAINSTLLNEIREGLIQPIAAPATLITDQPEKIHGAVGDKELATLAMELARRFRAAESEVLIITPYYIPQKAGVALVEELLAKGTRVIIITNSLASTNHVPVHSGYARYRKRLLLAGVEFYEIRVDNQDEENEWGGQPEKITLHSKATIIDRNSVFIGSLNFDPRSILINTEMGIFIESERAGAGLAESVLESLSRKAYRVDLDEKGKLIWISDHQGQHEIHHSEPQAGWWRKMQVKLYGLLPIESQL